MRFRVNAPQVVAEQVDGEVIVINLETGHYYSLVDAGAAVWTALARGGAPSDAVAAVADRYAGDSSAIADGVSQFVGELERESLIVLAADGDASAGGGPGPSPRVDPAARPTEVRPPFVVPRLEKYIDMQKLLALDPVLEIDESGWPKPNRT